MKLQQYLEHYTSIIILKLELLICLQTDKRDQALFRLFVLISQEKTKKVILKRGTHADMTQMITKIWYFLKQTSPSQE